MSGMKLGFTIAENVFGYGLVIPHYGTIVVGSGNRIGNYAVLHTSTCITAGKKNIGDGLYLSTGAKVLRDVQLLCHQGHQPAGQAGGAVQDLRLLPEHPAQL